MNAKTRADELYNLHLALASTDGRNFRKTVMDTLMEETGCTLAAAATHYNNAKKQAPVEGLGRAPVAAGVRKPGSTTKAKGDELQDDDECFSVIELLKHDDSSTVGRCRSHLMQGDASEEFDDRIKYKPNSVWIMIKGLGPLHGETFKLHGGEQELKRYTPAVEVVIAKEEPLLVD